ncbi:MAG TPA: PQQ-dependent sugar dehydrogenase, partial [Candidatus Limnocylindrales bacterium]
MSARRSPFRQRLGATASALAVLAALAGTVVGPAVAPVAAATPPAATSPGLFATSATPPQPRSVKPASGPTPANGFVDSTVFTGLTNPTKVRFAADGRVFVAEKSGLVLEFQSVTDPNPPTVWADLSSEVDNYWDRGLLGFALSPNFVNDHTFYVQYGYDHNPVADLPGDPYPNAPSKWNDACPSPPNPTTDGCTILGRISRVSGVPSGTPLGTSNETVLVQGWCQQYPSHSNDDLWIGPDGDIYSTAGEGASFSDFDYGQLGGTTTPLITPVNPCGDPPAAAGTADTIPTAEGGSLRSQSIRRAGGQGAAVLNGALLRIDPSTGAGVVGNPYYTGNGQNNQSRILAFGLRNPFRFTFQPGSGTVWIGDVGDVTWEEIDRLALPATTSTNDFGWPCYEGPEVHPGWPSGINQCTSLASAGNAVAPFYAYNHDASVVPGASCDSGTGLCADGCLYGSSSISGMTFYNATSYPAKYKGALFFTDHSRDCIWAMLPTSGQPDPTKIVPFDVGGVAPPSCKTCAVDLETDPVSGDIFYANYDAGQIHRISYGVPQAVAHADVTSGGVPLTVHFDGSASTTSAPPLTYAWTIPNGSCDSLTSATPTCTFNAVGTSHVTLKVTDANSVSNTSAPITITAGDSPPTAVIDTIDGVAPPAQPTLDGQGNPPAVRPSGVPAFFAVGDTISFTGHAVGAVGGNLPASDLTWNVRIYHCPSNCHTHDIETLTGTSTGSFGAPDHSYPSVLWIQLTGTDSFGLSDSASVYLYPKTSTFTITSSPSGITVTAGTFTGTTPFTDTFFQGGAVGLSAPVLPMVGGTQYGFVSWSDGLPATHGVTAPASNPTYSLRYIPDSRLAGPDRYGTSAAAAAQYPAHQAVVYVASGAQFADAATAAAIAGWQGAPLLLVQSTAIPAAISTQLTRLAPTRIVVLGGTAAISAGVFDQLKAFTTPTTGQ